MHIFSLSFFFFTATSFSFLSVFVSILNYAASVVFIGFKLGCLMQSVAVFRDPETASFSPFFCCCCCFAKVLLSKVLTALRSLKFKEKKKSGLG